MATLETTDESDNVIVIPSALVGSAVTLGLVEEMLLDDSGATGGVAYDNKHTTDPTDSNREVTIGNSGKVAAWGVDAIKLKDLPDDNVLWMCLDLFRSRRTFLLLWSLLMLHRCRTDGVIFENSEVNGLFKCKTDPCLFYLRYLTGTEI